MMAYERTASQESFPIVALTDSSIPEILRKHKSNGRVSFEAVSIGANPEETFEVFLKFKQKVRKKRWTGMTIKDLEKDFLETFSVAEKDFFAGLAGKAQFMVQHNSLSEEEEPAFKLENVDQLKAGSLVEAKSDEWEACYSEHKSIDLNNSSDLLPLKYGGSWLERLDNFLNEPQSSKAAFTFSVIMALLIGLSSLTFVLETEPFVYRHENTKNAFETMEIFCVSVFSLELVLRFLIVSDKVLFMKEIMNIVDFIAILPFYLDLVLKNAPLPGLSVLRAARLARVFRVVRVMKGMLSVLGGTLMASLEPLYMLLFFVALVIISFSSILYYAERGTFDRELRVWKRPVSYYCPSVCLQEDEFLGCEYIGQLVYVESKYKTGPFKGQCEVVYEQSPFDSIVATMWYTAQTMTVVGYGEMTPASALGKGFGSLTLLIGVLSFALPVSVIQTNFSIQLQKYRNKAIYRSIRRKMSRYLSFSSRMNSIHMERIKSSSK